MGQYSCTGEAHVGSAEGGKNNHKRMKRVMVYPPDFYINLPPP